jgi:hypothetical protein
LSIGYLQWQYFSKLLVVGCLVPLTAVTTPDILINVAVHVKPEEVGFGLISPLILPKMSGYMAVMVLSKDFLLEFSGIRDIPAVLEDL